MNGDINDVFKDFERLAQAFVVSKQLGVMDPELAELVPPGTRLDELGKLVNYGELLKTHEQEQA